jgi:ribose transport system substrate-binding protein
MSKTKTFIFAVISLIAVLMFILPACAPQPPAVTETAAETAATTTAETEVEETAPAVLTFEELRETAKADKEYSGAPLTGKKLAYTDIMGGIPFCISVGNSVKSEFMKAGGTEADWIYADNQYNSTVGLQNADIILAKKPDVFIEFQADAKVNAIVSQKFGAAGIPIIAVDVPVPGAPFMGVNNWKVAYMAGEYAAKLAEDRWGGWDAIDIIVLGQMPAGGEVTMLRSEGFGQAFADKYGKTVDDPKIVRSDFGMGEAEESKAAMSDVLAANPDAKKIVLTSINEETMQGAIAAIETAGRWNKDDIIIITQGVDDVGKTQIREGKTDAGIAYFPETYGKYLVPMAIAMLTDQKVPPAVYIDNEVITKDNIDQFYPE